MPTSQANLDATASRRRELRRKGFGQHLRRLREERDLTQEQLANASGVSRTMIVQVEAGQRSIMLDRLWDLADALGLPADQLLTSSQWDRTGGHWAGTR